MTEGYHYTACGLDYVYLQNGYEVRDTKHGKAISIKDAQGLHDTIARTVLGSPSRLRGQEVRFIRSLLKLSQDGLARALRVRRGAVARWESEPHKAIPGTADAALRMFYALKAEKPKLAEKVVDVLTELDEIEHRFAVLEHASFRETDGEWTREAA